MSRNRGVYDFIFSFPYQMRFFYERLLIAIICYICYGINFNNLDLVFIEMNFIFVDFMDVYNLTTHWVTVMLSFWVVCGS